LKVRLISLIDLLVLSSLPRNPQPVVYPKRQAEDPQIKSSASAMGSPNRINQDGINGQKVIFGILFVRMCDHEFW
jgi:hypothetical protein